MCLPIYCGSFRPVWKLSESIWTNTNSPSHLKPASNRLPQIPSYMLLCCADLHHHEFTVSSQFTIIFILHSHWFLDRSPVQHRYHLLPLKDLPLPSCPAQPSHQLSHMTQLLPPVSPIFYILCIYMCWSRFTYHLPDSSCILSLCCLLPFKKLHSFIFRKSLKKKTCLLFPILSCTVWQPATAAPLFMCCFYKFC